MNKLMTVVAASVCAVALAGRASAAEEKSAETNAVVAVTADAKDGEALEEEESSVFEAEVGVDFFSAYIWRNVVQTDKPVMQGLAAVDFTLLDPFTFGFWYWQGWDLSSDRKGTFKRRLNESDYNVHAGYTAWENEDGDMSLSFEGGHEWYTYHFDRDRNAPSTRELYLKGTFENPIVGVYGQASWLYDDIGEFESGFYYECGFNKEIELCDSLTLGADWNVSFADDDYISTFLIGEGVKGGFAGTTVKTYLNWAVTDWMSLVGTLAYTGILNSDARRYYNEEDKDLKDTLWGGFSVKFAF